MAVLGSDLANIPSYNARYNRPLGMIYIDTPEVNNIFSTLPVEVKRMGFSECVRKDICARIDAVGGLYSDILEGKLVYFGIDNNKPAVGIEKRSFSIGINAIVPEGGKKSGEPKDGLVFFSAKLYSPVGLVLLRDLVNSEFGKDTKLCMFALMGEKNANHVVGITQNWKKKNFYDLTSDEDEEHLDSIAKRLTLINEIRGFPESLDARFKDKNIRPLLINRVQSRIEVVQQRYNAEVERNMVNNEEDDLGFMEDEREEIPSIADHVHGVDY